MPGLIHHCFIYCVVIFISIRISLFFQNQIFVGFFFRKLEGDSKFDQEKIDERNMLENIERGNIEPITKGTVMIARSHNQMK